jgi:2-polyprenyl-3-methyl-5-hydroxy-6-metoxy-1,4-benzoquinol methylase
MKVNYPKVGRIDYTTYWEGRGFAINKKLKEREVIMRDIVPSGSKVLDAGCGNSLLPVELKKKGCTVSVGDVSPIVLDGYKPHGISGVVLDLDKVTETAKAMGQYDYIILSEVLEHTVNPEEIIAALKPHTKHFLLTIPNSAFYPFRFRLMFGGSFLKQWVGHPSEHVRYWSHNDFLEWLTVQGLTVEKAIPSNGLSVKGLLPFLKNLWPNLFGHQIVYLCTSK